MCSLYMTSSLVPESCDSRLWGFQQLLCLHYGAVESCHRSDSDSDQLRRTCHFTYQQLVSETSLSRPGQPMYVYTYRFIFTLDINLSTTLHHLLYVTS